MRTQNFVILSIVLLTGLMPSVSFASVNPEAISRAEGADRSAAAHAESWTGTLIGINNGENSFIITEGTALDHIKVYAQRSIMISNDTELYKNGAQASFNDFDIGDRLVAEGSYNATKRIITATKVSTGKGAESSPVASVDAAPVEKTTAVKNASTDSGLLSRSLSRGSEGSDVVWLQKYLIKKGFLYVPANIALGYFGPSTEAAVEKYQKSEGISAIGVVGPQTRSALNNS